MERGRSNLRDGSFSSRCPRDTRWRTLARRMRGRAVGRIAVDFGRVSHLPTRSVSAVVSANCPRLHVGVGFERCCLAHFRLLRRLLINRRILDQLAVVSNWTAAGRAGADESEHDPFRLGDNHPRLRAGQRNHHAHLWKYREFAPRS